jgi:hypothetical protein
MATKTAKPKASSPNGQPDQLAEAIAYEQAIAEEAAAVREGEDKLTSELFLRLWPLLRRPIPAGFIVSTPKSDGKPYDSTGVKSLQVLIDRMDNVLTPLWWGYSVDYVGGEGTDDRGRPARGKLALVRVYVGDKDTPLLARESHGGVNQASTIGNLFKGSETNAAKRAFAQVGPAHEVYLGATDLDPDVNPDAAKAQEQKAGEESGEEKLAPERAERLAAIVAEAGLDAKHVNAKLRGFGVKKIADLSSGQAVQLWEWLQEQLPKAGEG